MLVRMADGRTSFIDFRERAPGGRNAQHVPGQRRQADRGQHHRLSRFRRAGHGARPGIRLEKVRRQAIGRLVRPAVELAAKGFPLSYAQAESLQASAKGPLGRFAESKRIFLRDGKLYSGWGRVGAAGTGAHAGAHRAAGRHRFLRRRNRAPVGERHRGRTNPGILAGLAEEYRPALRSFRDRRAGHGGGVRIRRKPAARGDRESPPRGWAGIPGCGHRHRDSGELGGHNLPGCVSRVDGTGAARRRRRDSRRHPSPAGRGAHRPPQTARVDIIRNYTY